MRASLSSTALQEALHLKVPKLIKLLKRKYGIEQTLKKNITTEVTIFYIYLQLST